MVIASVPIIFSAVLFVFFDLDTSSPRKNHLIEDRNLAIEIKKLDMSIKELKTTYIEKDKPIMSNENNNQSDKVSPPPPPPPTPPQVQYSTEDFKPPMPDIVKILNENK